MAQLSNAAPGYQSITVGVTGTATGIQELALTQLGYSLNGGFRNVHIEIDPESQSTSKVRIGDGSLGSTVGGHVQKGRVLVPQTSTLNGKSADYDSGMINDVYLQSLQLQTDTGEQLVNIELWSI